MKTYLFDMDGTLIDSMPACIHSVLCILEECRFPCPPHLVETITPLGLDGTAAYFEELGIGLTKEAFAQRMGDYLLEAYRHTIPAKSHVVEVLHQLKAEGASLNVLTASPHITVDACLKRLGLFALFDNVWASSEDFQTTKADPHIYICAAARLGVPAEQVLFLDDNPDAVATAKSIGMQVCGVFDESSAAHETAMRETADFYIRDFEELLSLPL